MLRQPWRIEMLGGLRARQEERCIERFRTRAVGSLLAYLAYYSDRAHSREVLTTLFWPDATPEAGRHNLRQTLLSLRRLLESPGIPAGSVLVTDYLTMRLHPDAIRTDVTVFTGALRAAVQAKNSGERIAFWRQAVDCYGGDLLPGCYEEWVQPERERLAEQQIGALHGLGQMLAESGAWQEAIAYAKRAVAMDPLREETQSALIAHYAASGQRSAARRQYQTYEQRLREELDEAPPSEMRALIEQMAGSPETVPSVRLRASVVTLPPARPSSIPFDPSAPHIPTRSSRLLLYLTRFVGREAEISRLVEMMIGKMEGRDNAEIPSSHPSLLASRLVTLTGLGGIGKTRLAMEVARRMETHGEVYYAPLSELTQARQLPYAIAEALGLARAASADPLEQAVEFLNRRQNPVMLVLDNFEQLLPSLFLDSSPHKEPDHSSVLCVRTLLERVPGLACLVTSRRPLHITGEREFEVSLLPIPPWPGTPERLLEYDSVRLFVDRGQEARADFALTQRNGDAIVTLCHRLEGLPLAIELAAARSGTLTPAQMLAQMEDRLAFLVNRKQDSSTRHRTLRATIAWSFEMLPPHVQRLFARLSVFRGGWTLEMATEVCGEPQTLEGIELLLEHSLLLAEEAGETMRFRMLETLREYAWEQLSQEEQQAGRHGHAEAFTRLAEQAAAHLRGPQQRDWFLRLDAELENLRAAFAWAEANGEAEIALRLAGALWWYLWIRTRIKEGRAWLETALALSGDMPSLRRAKALTGFGLMLSSLGEREAGWRKLEESQALYKAGEETNGLAEVTMFLGSASATEGNVAASAALYRESLELYQKAGDRIGIADCLARLGGNAWSTGDYETARVRQEESLALRREAGDSGGIAHSLNMLGHIALYQADYVAARACYEQSLVLVQERGAGGNDIADSLVNLAETARLLADYPKSLSLYRQSVQMCRDSGVKRMTAISLLGLGNTHCDAGEVEPALTCVGESLWLFAEVHARFGIAECVDTLACLVQMQGQPERAARLFGICEAMREATGTVTHQADAARRDRYLAAVQKDLGREACQCAWNAGRDLSFEAALDELKPFSPQITRA